MPPTPEPPEHPEPPPEPGTTIRCQQVVELVTDYLEGALESATETEFEAHLSLCPGCAAYLEQIRDTVRSVGRITLDGLSETARSRLLAAFGVMSAEYGSPAGRLPRSGTDADPVT